MGELSVTAVKLDRPLFEAGGLVSVLVMAGGNGRWYISQTVVLMSTVYSKKEGLDNIMLVVL
jgi:hypothetical protein